MRDSEETWGERGKLNDHVDDDCQSNQSIFDRSSSSSLIKSISTAINYPTIHSLRRREGEIEREMLSQNLISKHQDDDDDDDCGHD